MLAYFDNSSWFVLVAVIIVVAFALGYMADLILGTIGFGVIFNMILFAMGGFAGIFVLDHAFSNFYLPMRHSTPYAWFGAGIGGGTFLLLIGCVFKGLIQRS